MTMAQLWGGRFTKQTDQLVFDFNASITFDKILNDAEKRNRILFDKLALLHNDPPLHLVPVIKNLHLPFCFSSQYIL